jgi:hypothetical protein
MNIPRKDVITFLLTETLKSVQADSQQELANLLNKRLKKSNPGFTISGPRARLIALETPGIRTRISTRKGKAPKKCPGCGQALRKGYSKNLRGRRVLVRLSCRRCPYSGSGGKFAPSRYRFSGKG